ncbi:MAG: alpha-amylase/4-alpha-glucanotransferase domain-containing protein [Thermodesulfobacteriota bacterium]
MIYFPFCIHNHQPVGNFDHVLEKAYRESYFPFLEALSGHPGVKVTLHNSGFLLDWIVEKHPEYIELLKKMVSSGQVEVMGGGYYEPILSVIPDRDRAGQVRLMSDRIEGLFGKRPRGIWLAERVWDPTLPGSLTEAGVEYILVDDYHFIKAGLDREDLGGYYITEDRGKVVKVFPGSERLRYLIPFKPVEMLDEHFKNLPGFLRRGNAAIYGDDGEKFGVWPGTHKWVFTEGWLEEFLVKMESLDNVAPVTLSEYIDRQGPLGRVYLPTTSYMEMGEWSLPAPAAKEYALVTGELKARKDGERIGRFMQGGTWRNFFSKYPESNWMHKRMLLVSSMLEELRGRLEAGEIEKAREDLYKAQCNDAYWHGIFGGLYLPHLRGEIYKRLIMSEETLLHAGHTEGLSIVKSDLDADGSDEVIMRAGDLNMFLSPGGGGALLELDYKPLYVNLLNTLTRWAEGYHDKLKELSEEEEGGSTRSIHSIVKSKEKDMIRFLKTDSGRRRSLVEHFFPAGATLQAFSEGALKDLGDFHDGRFDAEINGGSVSLSRDALVGKTPVTVKKEVRAGEENSFFVDYVIQRSGKKARGAPVGPLLFGVEFNVILPGCDGPLCSYSPEPKTKGFGKIGLGSSGAVEGITGLTLTDRFTGLALTIGTETGTERGAALWRFPVYTVSLSEAGFERGFQGSCLVFLFPFDPGADRPLSVSFLVSVEGFKPEA